MRTCLGLCRSAASRLALIAGMMGGVLVVTAPGYAQDDAWMQGMPNSPGPAVQRPQTSVTGKRVGTSATSRRWRGSQRTVTSIEPIADSSRARAPSPRPLAAATSGWTVQSAAPYGASDHCDDCARSVDSDMSASG